MKHRDSNLCSLACAFEVDVAGREKQDPCISCVYGYALPTYKLHGPL